MHLKIPLNSTALFLYILGLHLQFTYIRDFFSSDYSVRNADACMRAQGSKAHIGNLKHEIKFCSVFYFWLKSTYMSSLL